MQLERFVPIVQMAAGGISVLVILYIFIALNNLTFSYGSYAALFGSLMVLSIGLLDLLSIRNWKTLAQIVFPSLLTVAFIYHTNTQVGVPIPVIVLLVIAVIGAFLTRNTTFGRYLYAIGGNPDAARLSGISLRKHILAAFCLLGGLVGVASILHTGRVGSASPDAGTLMELDAIAACVIGGTSLMGGRGTVFGALLGALIMASLDNGMSLESVENSTQYIIKGAVLVAAVGFDMLGRRKG